MRRRETIDEWLTTLGKAAGLAMLIAFAVLFIAGGRVEPLLVSSAMGLYGLSKAGEAVSALKSKPPESPPPPDATAVEQKVP